MFLFWDLYNIISIWRRAVVIILFLKQTQNKKKLLILYPVFYLAQGCVNLLGIETILTGYFFFCFARKGLGKKDLFVYFCSVFFFILLHTTWSDVLLALSSDYDYNNFIFHIVFFFCIYLQHYENCLVSLMDILVDGKRFIFAKKSWLAACANKF